MILFTFVISLTSLLSAKLIDLELICFLIFFESNFRTALITTRLNSSTFFLFLKRIKIAFAPLSSFVPRTSAACWEVRTGSWVVCLKEIWALSNFFFSFSNVSGFSISSSETCLLRFWEMFALKCLFWEEKGMYSVFRWSSSFEITPYP